MRHAKSKGMVRYDVTRDADRLAAVKADRTRGTLQPEELVAVLAASTGTPWEPYLALLGLLGLRRGELLGLSWECVDLDAAAVTVARNMVTLPGGALVLGTTKTDRERTLDLSPRLVSLLRAHRAQQAADRLAAGPLWAGTFSDEAGQTVTLVFTDEAGRPLPGHRLNSALNRIATTALGRNVNPHKLRHSTASMMLGHGDDLAAVAGVLGHASPATTVAVYSHALDRNKRRATASVAAAVGDW